MESGTHQVSTETTVPKPDLIRIDPEGDVILVVKDKSKTPPEVRGSLLVSTKVLSLASPVFEKLLGPNFAEGVRKRKFSCPEIVLHGDEPDSMRIMLQALHYQRPTELETMGAETLASLAIHCDKYDTVKALNPMLWNMLDRVRSISAKKDYGFLLLAARMLHYENSFREMVTKCLMDLTPASIEEWEEVEMLDIITDIRGKAAEPIFQLG